MTDLSSKAMLAKLSISQWSARKFDKKATDKVSEEFGTASDTGRYSKVLIAKDAIKSIQKIAGEARTYHYEQTLPWNDDGARILPSANFQDYSAKMRDLRRVFEAEVSDFVYSYPNMREAARIALNGLFNEDDYPDESKIKAKYGFDVTIDPLPNAADFRVSLQFEDMQRIQDDIKDRVEKAGKAAMADLWNRLYEAVSHMAERLGDPENKFKNSLVGNIQELVELLPRLNITDDPDLERMRQDVEARLLSYSPDELRAAKESSMFGDIRKDTAGAANDILATMAGYMGGGEAS